MCPHSGRSRRSRRSGVPHNQPLLWTGPRRVRMLFYSLAQPARRVAGHRASSVMSPHHPEFDSLLRGDDDFKLWMAVAQAISARRKSEGEAALTPVQRLVWRLWAASGVIGNGGFWDQERFLDEWASAYDEADIPEAAQAIRSAPVLMVRVRAGDEGARAELNAVEKSFYRVNEGTRHLVAALIRKNPAEALNQLVPRPPRKPAT